jgi:heme exporter protein B
MWRDAALVAGRDLRIEARSRVTLHQVGPFALLVLVLFAFALDPARDILERATPGLYWLTVLFSALLAVARSAALDETGGVRDALRLSALAGPGGAARGRGRGALRRRARRRRPARGNLRGGDRCGRIHR